MEFYSHICIIFFVYVVFIILGIDVLHLIDVYQLELVSFMIILYVILSNTIYTQLQSLLTSIVTSFIRLLNIFSSVL